MADRGSLFGNLLNNPIAYDWNTAPNVGFKGGDFQSFLKPPAAAVGDWRSNPDLYMKKLNDLKKQYPNSTQEQLDRALSSAPPNSRLEDSVANMVERAAYNQTPEGMREQLEMGKEMAKEQAKQTLKFQTLANLPGQIERGFAADKYYQGMSQIPEIYRGTFAAVPSMNIQAPGYSAPQMRYFN